MSKIELSPAAKYLSGIRSAENPIIFPPQIHSDLIRNTHLGSSSVFDVANFQRDGSLYEKLREKLQSVKINDEILYVVEGDTLLDEAQLEIYALQKEAVNHARSFEIFSDMAGMGKISLSGEEQRGLLGITEKGKIVRWKPGLILKYCILRETFPDHEKYKIVKENFLLAADAWEKTCGVKFEHDVSSDQSEKTDATDIGVVFVVRYIDAQGIFIASAFFPNDPDYRRRVLVDPSYFEPGRFDRIGVLRHELGHVLGFRHEHIRAEAPTECGDEDVNNVTPLTAYDSKSVMHYLCGEHGDPQLNITPTDIIGAQRVYGPPLQLSVFVS